MQGTRLRLLWFCRRSRRTGRWDFEAEGFDSEFVGEKLTVLFDDDGETAAVIPHGPANAVLFQSGANIGNPRGAVLRRSGFAIDAEFIAGDGNIPMSTPGGDLSDFGVDAGFVPVIGSVTGDVELVDGIRFKGFRGNDVLWIGGVGQVVEIVPEARAPGGALVREDVRLVEMEIVDDVGIANRLNENEVIIVGPARAGDDDGVVRRSLPNGGNQTRLDAIPAVGIARFGFVEDFEEYKIGIEIRVMLREGAPEVGELFDKRVVLGEPFLEVGVGMHVQNDGQAVIQNHLDGGIQIGEIVCGDAIRLISAEHRSGVDAQPDVIEADITDELNILGRVPGLEMLLGVALGVVNLGKPFAEIDAVAKVLGAMEGKRVLRLRRGREGKRYQKRGQQ